MNHNIRISVNHLSKIFYLYKKNIISGVSTDGILALYHLFKKTLKNPNHVLNQSTNNYLQALDDIHFNVEASEILGVIGRNGAGKSTLLKILGRVLSPTSGNVTINGRVMSMLELGIGFAPDLTVRENIQIQGRLSGFSPRQIQEVEENILHFSELTAYKDTPLLKCPSGSFSQLCFSTMLHLKVDVILADEILAVGDARFKKICEERVLAASQQGASVIFVSHDMQAIQRLCSRVILLDKGKIIKIGNPKEVIQTYTQELLAGTFAKPLTIDEMVKHCQLLDLRLLNAEKAVVGAISITEDGYIDCLIKISKPNSQIMIQFELWQGKFCILSAEKNYICEQENIPIFSVRIKIQKNLLNEALYTAKCRLYYIHHNFINESNQTLVGEEAFDFTVMNYNPNESVWRNWEWGRPGMISPKLQWSLTHEELSI